MQSMLTKISAAGLLIAAGAAFAHVAAQDRTLRPGEPTRPIVWIQNHDPSEAVPITIEGLSANLPALRVQIAGTAGTAVAVRSAGQIWEYETLTIPVTQDPTGALNVAGAQGWEATGIAFSIAGGTGVVLKRPR